MHRMALSGWGMGGLGAGLGAGLRIAGPARSALAVGAVAAVSSVAYVRSWPKETVPKDPGDSKLILERPIMEAICGGIGEIAQICVLYPLETIKVKCQSDGTNARAVLRQLLAQGGPSALRALYAGFLSAALCSVLVGSVHYASFCVSKRMALQAAGASSGGDAAGGGHGGGGGSDGANLVAATVGALATALVESPCELFRHQAQAGTVSGNFLKEMVASVQKHGLGSLYFGFVPFLMESFPYDITELGTYSQLNDMRAAAVKKGDARAQLMGRVPDQVWDLSIGAAAGVASVLVSMPLDVVKTYMQTHGADVAATAPGLGGQVAAFWTTGSRMVARGGPGALFVGLVPRLVQQVPSTTICWWAIERARSVLEPYTKA